jgi:pyridoxine 4-dehydrogenase
VAINWVLCQGALPIVGAKSAAQVKDNLGALGWRLSSAEFRRLDAASKAVPRGATQNIFQTD